jgi:hypothetical protein
MYIKVQCVIGGREGYLVLLDTEYSDWQRQLPGVNSIMMEKSAQACDSGRCTPTPITLSTITYKVVVYAPVERADTLPQFLLYPYMHSVVLESKQDCKL